MASGRHLLNPSPSPSDSSFPSPAPRSSFPSPVSAPAIRADPLASGLRSRSSIDRISFEVPDPFRSLPSRRFESDRFTTASGKELADAEARIVFVGDPRRTAERVGKAGGAAFAGNSIRTAKYSIITFLPRNLFEQFRRLSYLYFLAITVLNQLPQVAVFGRGASVIPLAFVLIVTAIKDAYEDWRRHRSDRIENNRTAAVLSAGPDARFLPKRWRDIKVGEVVRVSANETLPADMVLLSTSDSTGVAFIQTINLDGESNLKTRYAKQETLARNFETGVTTADDGMPAVIRCERPNRNIYGFQANMEVDGKRISLGPTNIVLRGCELKNTSWAVGVVVYAGKETKVMLNNSGAPSRRSRLETQLNRETIILAAMLIGMCSTVSILAGIWLANHQSELVLSQYFHLKDYSSPGDNNYNYYGLGMQVFITFLMAVIVYQVIIPISLYISMELVQLGQAFFMGADASLYDEASKSKFQCRALNINEDLGQIKYVFSDKTGTLTENKMEFQCATIRGIDYSAGEQLEGYSVIVGDQFITPKMAVKTDPELLRLMRDAGKTKHKFLLDFFLALATCNTVVPLVLETTDPKRKLIDYQGESPDEQALVYAAASYGIVLLERTSGYITIDVLGNRERYDILGIHEFDSDRKRMSVVVACPDNTVKLFVKGADVSMFNIIEDIEKDSEIVGATKSHLNKYSSMGLRTLVVGMHELNQLEFDAWQSAYEHANNALLGRANLLRSVATNVEINVQILGATGIEDKLQLGVPEAIESLRQAGIKVWVLTGDKQETAISIGYSSKLLTGDMTQFIFNHNSKEACRRSLKEAIITADKVRTASRGIQSDESLSESARAQLALIVDGTSLVHILETDLEEDLYAVATQCDVVLCCRVAPLQKAGIVALIKKRTDDMTLAIGDGANDVSMIQTADVGVGISGQEGRQAVMASDFAMGQFRFLVPLLLVHGHWNYQRMAYMILYNFYKNAFFVLVLFWYALYCAFTLTTAINEWSSLLYTVLYTSLPIIVVGILDKNLSRHTLLKFPKLYASGQKDERYNVKLFAIAMVEALWQSLAVFYIPYFAYQTSTIDISSLGDLWAMAPVVLVNLQLSLDVVRWNWIIHAVIWATVVATLICMFIIDSIWSLPGYGAIFNLMGTWLFWWLLLVISMAGMLPHFVKKAFEEYFTPNDIQIAREMEKFDRIHHSTVPSEIEMHSTS